MADDFNRYVDPLSLGNLHYYFNDIDVDRYIINGKKTSVNISARELSIEQLGRASATWQNYHLIYTHG
jgi:uncharacterized membrane protein (UPF0182 family)